jgi:hypothetical protein
MVFGFQLGGNEFGCAVDVMMTPTMEMLRLFIPDVQGLIDMCVSFKSFTHLFTLFVKGLRTGALLSSFERLALTTIAVDAGFFIFHLKGTKGKDETKQPVCNLTLLDRFKDTAIERRRAIITRDKEAPVRLGIPDYCKMSES